MLNCLSLFVITFLIVSATASAQSNSGKPWNSDLVQNANLWTNRLNDAIVSNADGGLRVEVAPGKTWAIAAIPNIIMPANTISIEVSIKSLSGGGKWLMRLYNGDFSTLGVFESVSTAGVHFVTPEPGLLILTRGQRLEIQLGLEGQPGSYVVFQGVKFITGKLKTYAHTIPGQKDIPCVDYMPNLPEPLKILNWRQKARDFDRLAFDFDAKGKFLPLIWLDNSRVNIDFPTFGMPSYVGGNNATGENHEGITCMGAVLGATVAGINKSKQNHNYVAMCEAYYNKKNGMDLAFDSMNVNGTTGSFWYDILPNMQIFDLAFLYPHEMPMQGMTKTIANRWRDACIVMGGGKTTIPDFDHTAFNFKTMKPEDNGQWREPDSAAGVAWLEYAAYRKWKDPQYLQAADWAMRFLDDRKKSPYYECLLPWGVITCAKMNAELGRKYDLDKMLNWCFGWSQIREGWGIILGNWGGYDCAGLMGSIVDSNGYAFLMDTFLQAGALVPIVRYDPEYARAIGKWMLNLTNAVRLFYPNQLPRDHQTYVEWKGDPKSCIAYEGLRNVWEGISPYATGDPLRLNWGPKTDLGIYGSCFVGVLGGIVHPTNVAGVLQLNCLDTDFYHGKAYPTYLVYNPYPQPKKVRISLGDYRCDLYDAVSNRIIAKNVVHDTLISIPSDFAMVLVLTPPNGKTTIQRDKKMINGVVVNYHVAQSVH